MKHFILNIDYWRDEDERPISYEITYNGNWEIVEKEEWINELNATDEKIVKVYTTDACFTLEQIEDIFKTMKGIR